jgi:hypothetical protein
MIARYRTVIAAAVSQLFFGGVRYQCGNVLNAQSKKGGLFSAHPRSITGGLSRWTLSATGAERLGLPPSIADSGNIDLDLGILFACIFSERRRFHRLTIKEVTRLFGPDAPAANIPHVLGVNDDGSFYVLRVYQATRDLRNTLSRLQDITDHITRKKTLATWMRDRDYGVLVLVPSMEKLARFKAAIERHPLCRRVRLEIALGPLAETMAAEFRRWRASHE